VAAAGRSALRSAEVEAAEAHLGIEIGQGLIDNCHVDVGAGRRERRRPVEVASGLLGDDEEVGERGDAGAQLVRRRILDVEEGFLDCVEFLDRGIVDIAAKDGTESGEALGARAPSCGVDLWEAVAVAADDIGGHAEPDDHDQQDEHLTGRERHRWRRYPGGVRHLRSGR